MQVTNVRKVINTQLWILIAIYLVLLSLSLDKLHWGDDGYYSQMSETRPLLDWWWERYRVWSGRIFIDLLTVTTITWEWFWRLAIPATLLLLVVSMVRLVKWQVTPAKLLLVLLLLANAPAKVISESFYWVTGFYNYLLPTALALFCFSEINSPKELPKWRIVLSSLSVFIFAYQEQVTIIFCLALCLSLYKERTSLKWFILGLTLINSVLLFLAPGNSSRVIASTFMYFPNYADFNILHKALLGMDKLYQVFVMPDNWPLVFLLVAIVLVSSLKQDRSIAEKVSVFPLMLYVSFFLLQRQYGADLATPLIHIKYAGQISYEAVSKGETYGGYLVFLLVMSSVLVLLLGLFNSSKGSQNAFLCLFLGVLSVMMLGFSPTVYVSNFRVQMVFEIGVILALLYLLREINWYNVDRQHPKKIEK